MNRIIKFRAWDKFQKKYVFEGFHIIGEVTVFGGIESIINNTAKARKEKYGYKTSIEAWDDFIIEQYAGVKDKTGKDIYEGDIVHSEHFGQTEEIKWVNNGFWMLNGNQGVHLPSTLEIVGNINKDKQW